MPATFIGAGSPIAASATANQTVTIPWPSGYSPVANDVAIVFAVGRLPNNTPAVAPTPSDNLSSYTYISTPTPWTIFYDTPITTDIQTTVFYKVLSGSETSPQYTNLGSTIYGTNGIGYVLTIFRGLDTNSKNFIDADFQGSNYNLTNNLKTSSTTHTTNKFDSLVIQAITGDTFRNFVLSTAQNFLPAAVGSDYATTAGADFGIGIAYKTQSSPGAVTNPTWLSSGSTFYGSFIALSLQSAKTVSGSSSSTSSAIRGPVKLRSEVISLSSSSASAVGVIDRKSPHFIGSSPQMSVSSALGTQITALWPTGYTPTLGHTAVVVVMAKTGLLVSTPAPTPSGYTYIGTSFFRPTNSNDNNLQLTVFYRNLFGGDSAPSLLVPSEYADLVAGDTGNSSAGNRGVSIQMSVFAGIISSTSILDGTVDSSSNSVTTGWTPPNKATTKNKSMIMTVSGAANDHGFAFVSGSERQFFLAMSGSTFATVVGSDHSVGFAYRLITPPGTITLPTWTRSDTVFFDSPTVGLTFAVRAQFFDVSASSLATSSATRVVHLSRSVTATSTSSSTAVSSVTQKSARIVAVSTSGGSLAYPSGYSPTADDLAFIVFYGVTNGTTFIFYDPPSGYTLLPNSNQGVNFGRLSIFYRKLVGGDTTPVLVDPSGSNYRSIRLGMFIVRGASAGSSLALFDGNNVVGGFGSSPTYQPPGKTESNQNIFRKTLIFSCVVTSDNNNLSIPSPSSGPSANGFSALMSGSEFALNDTIFSGVSVGVAYRNASEIGSYQNPVWTQTVNGNDSWRSITFSLVGNPIGDAFITEGDDVLASFNNGIGGIGEVDAIEGDDVSINSLGYFGVKGSASTSEGADESTISGIAGIPIYAESIDGSGAFDDGQGNTVVPFSGVDVLALQDQSLGISTVDYRISPPGPENITIFDPNNPPDPYVSVVTAKLVAKNGRTVIADLTNAFGIEWREALNEAGFGKLSIPSDDPNTALLTPGRYIQCFLYGVSRFMWMIEAQPEKTLVSNQEEFGEITTVQGRGWIAELDYSIVYPEAGMSDPLNPQHRVFSFASPSWPGNRNWPGSVVEGRAGDLLPPRTVVGSENKTEPAPAGFPDPDANWIWATPKPHATGRCYFYKYFSNPSPQVLTFAASADNYYTLYLNGTPIMGESSDGLGWQSYKEVSLELPTGIYLIGVVAENISIASGPNPAGFLLSVYPGSSAASSVDNSIPYPGHPPRIQLGYRGSSVSLVQARLNELGFNSGPVDGYFGPITDKAVRAFQAKYAPPVDGWVGPITWAALFEKNIVNVFNRLVFSDASFKSLAYPAQPPGWTPGQILDKLLIESYGRNTLLFVGSTYSATTDSLGAPWTSGDPNNWSFIPEFGVPIGTTLLSTLDVLVQEGWIDYTMRGGAKFFNAYNAGTPRNFNQATSVTYQKNVNIKSLTFDMGEPRINRIVSKWVGGWHVTEDSADIAANGAYERFMTVNSDFFDEVVRQGRLVLAELRDPQHAIVVEVEPRPGFGETPYINFNVRDKVNAPSPTGGTGSYRVIAISVQQDEMGDPLFTLELNRRSRIIERQQFELLQTLAAGLIGPGSTSVLDVSNPLSSTVRAVA